MVQKDSETIELDRRGLMFIISSPSGAGKSTLSRMLLENEPELTMSVSVTTRPPRPGEVDGEHYHFVSHEEFQKLRDNNGLLEWAEVFGNFYGSPREPVEKALAEGRDVLFDVDWQGAQQISEKMGEDVVKVFILPPGADVLHERLKRRAQDPEEVIARRMSEAASEISHWPEYDYVIINDDLERAAEEIRAILRAERLKRHRRTGLHDFVREMTAGL